MTPTPAFSKSVAFLVATIKPWTRAVDAIRLSLIGIDLPFTRRLYAELEPLFVLRSTRALRHQQNAEADLAEHKRVHRLRRSHSTTRSCGPRSLDDDGFPRIALTSGPRRGRIQCSPNRHEVIMRFRLWALPVCACVCLGLLPARTQAQAPVEYRVLATSKTSTMQKEMQQAAEAGFRFGDVMGGDTAFGGSEVVVIMLRDGQPGRFDYRLLATNKTSTMQKEMQEAGDAGYEYRGQTVFKSTFGGKEVVAILEKTPDAKILRYEYRLLATKKTSTMQKELAEAGDQGFGFVGMTVAKTLVGGDEVVAILRRTLQ
jgi:hypothetical protein